MYSKEDIALLQPLPFTVFLQRDSVTLNKYMSMVLHGKRVNWSFPVAEYESVAHLLLDFLQSSKWFHDTSDEQMKTIKELMHCIYIEPRFSSRLPSSLYRTEIAKRKAHLYNFSKVKPPLASATAEKIDKKILQMKDKGKAIPELPDYRTSDGLEECMEILKITPPKADGFQFPTSDDLILWALEETTQQELVVAPCKECGQLFVKGANDYFCSRRCTDLNKVDCGRFCNDDEIASLYNSIYKALARNIGRSPKGHSYESSAQSSSEILDALFSDLSTRYKNFTYTEHSFSESDFKILNKTFREKIFAPRYETFKCFYRRYKIQELSEEEYDVARAEFLDWLREVKDHVNNFTLSRNKKTDLVLQERAN